MGFFKISALKVTYYPYGTGTKSTPHFEHYIYIIILARHYIAV